MFKLRLLASTALIIVASLSDAAAQPATSAESQMRDSVANQNVNDEFLCTYGQFSVEAAHYASSSFASSRWSHVAVPIMGRGKTISTIKVKDIRDYSPSSSSREFSLGVYSNSPSGFPGRLIAGGTGIAKNRCKKVDVSIAPTKLKRNTEYWIVEKLGMPYANHENNIGWAVGPRQKEKAYVQTHRYLYSSAYSRYSSYTSPWTAQAKGPFVRVR